MQLKHCDCHRCFWPMEQLPVIYNQAVFCLTRVHTTSHSVSLSEAALPYAWFSGKRYLWGDISDTWIHWRTPQSGHVSCLLQQQWAKWGWWGRTNTKHLLREATQEKFCNCPLAKFAWIFGILSIFTSPKMSVMVENLFCWYIKSHLSNLAPLNLKRLNC